MTVVSLLDKATDSWSIIAAFVTILCVSLGLVVPKLQLSMNELEAGAPPDLRFGYSEGELNAWYDAIGEEGCRAYKQLAIWDLFPCMECYTLLLGGMLVKAARRAGANPQIALVMPFVMLCDVVETIIPAYGCILYPESRLPAVLIQISAAASRLKWITFVASNVILSFLFSASLLKPTGETKDKEKKD